MGFERTLRSLLTAGALSALTLAPSFAADAPAEIKFGTLYASAGRYASISMPVHYGLKLWVDQKNAEGGVFVKAFNKKIPVKLVAYDDQSNTATAATLYDQLITQDKVDVLIADSGSVLTSVAVPIARDRKMMLIDQTGTGATFFTPDNPYIALMADPASTIWPKPLADWIGKEGPGKGIKRVAILYSTNEFTGTQANSVRKMIKDSGAPIEFVFDQGVPTETSNYTVILNNIRASNPDFVIHLGYAPNDIAFLRNVADSGIKFKGLFCIYPGLETELLEKNVGAKGLNYVMSYVTAIDYRLQCRIRHEPRSVPRRLEEEISGRQGRVRLQFHRRLHDRPRARKGHVGGQQPRTARAAPRDLRAIGQAQDDRRHVRTGFDGRADRRTDAARPVPAGRARPPEAEGALSARDIERQGHLSPAVSRTLRSGQAHGPLPPSSC